MPHAGKAQECAGLPVAVAVGFLSSLKSPYILGDYPLTGFRDGGVEFRYCTDHLLNGNGFYPINSRVKIMHAVRINDKGILQVFLFGKLDQQSLFNAQSDLMLHPEYPHTNSMWVFDEGFECDFSNLGFIDLIDRIKRFFPLGATKKKAALLATTNTHFAMSQLFCDEARHECTPFTFRAFQDYHEAEAWLKGRRRLAGSDIVV